MKEARLNPNATIIEFVEKIGSYEREMIALYDGSMYSEQEATQAIYEYCDDALSSHSGLVIMPKSKYTKLLRIICIRR